MSSRPIEVHGRVVRGVSYLVLEHSQKTHGSRRFHLFRKGTDGDVYVASFESLKEVDTHLYGE